MTLEQLLRAYVASDDREEADRVAMLRLAMELEEPTSRDQARAHFTASAFVIDELCERANLVILDRNIPRGQSHAGWVVVTRRT